MLPYTSIEADFNRKTIITVILPSSIACIDFTDIVVDDDILEGDQWFTICVGNSSAKVLIVDDDGKCFTGEIQFLSYVNIWGIFHTEVSVGFDPTAYTVPEGNSAQLTLVRMGTAEQSFVVTVTTMDGSATGWLTFTCT